MFLFLEIYKVLISISKESGCIVLVNWIWFCENYFFWSVMLILFGNGNVIYVKFKFFLSYVINKYDNLDDLFFNRCNYGEIKDRIWFDKGKCIILK